MLVVLRCAGFSAADKWCCHCQQSALSQEHQNHVEIYISSFEYRIYRIPTRWNQQPDVGPTSQSSPCLFFVVTSSTWFQLTPMALLKRFTPTVTKVCTSKTKIGPGRTRTPSPRSWFQFFISARFNRAFHRETVPFFPTDVRFGHHQLFARAVKAAGRQAGSQSEHGTDVTRPAHLEKESGIFWSDRNGGCEMRPTFAGFVTNYFDQLAAKKSAKDKMANLPWQELNRADWWIAKSLVLQLLCVPI